MSDKLGRAGGSGNRRTCRTSAAVLDSPGGDDVSRQTQTLGSVTLHSVRTQDSNRVRPLFGSFAFAGAAAAAVDAPFVDLDRIDVSLADSETATELRQLDMRSGSGPKLRFICPYDAGVFIYSRVVGSIPIISGIQAYLDLYARGGRDLKQADHLLRNAIERRWRTA